MEKIKFPTPMMGWIPYWNLYPVKRELMKSVDFKSMTIADRPASINKLLRGKKVRLAPSSSICLLKNPGVEMVNFNGAKYFGVVAEGSVGSVYLSLSGEEQIGLCERVSAKLQVVAELFNETKEKYYSRKVEGAAYFWSQVDRLEPLECPVIPSLKLSENSETSNVLSQLFFRMMFGKKSAPLNEKNLLVAETHIGDEALFHRPSYKRVIDLGSVWKTVTNMPFVYAVWQKPVGEKIDKKILQVIDRACTSAEMKNKTRSTDHIPDPLPLNIHGLPIDLEKYWSHITYSIGDREIASLDWFFMLSSDLLGIEDPERVRLDFMKWSSYLENARSPSLVDTGY